LRNVGVARGFWTNYRCKDTELAGLDNGELVTIPSLPDIAHWNNFEAARQAIVPNLSLKAPAARYAA
jgi:short-subunit dehydrogenase